MHSIIKSTWLIFKKNKEFIGMITFQPVILFLMMSFLLSYSTTHKVAVINYDNGFIGDEIDTSISYIDGIEIVDVAEEQMFNELASGSIELAILIGENNTEQLELSDTANVQFLSLGNSEIEETAKLVVNRTITQVMSGDSTTVPQINFKSNEVGKKGISISYSIGFMILKIVGGASLLAELIINERKNKMKNRIMLSGISINKYLGGKGIVYLLSTMLGSFIFYIAALLLNFDLGMRHPVGFLIMLFTANILSVTLFLFASTLVDDSGSLWFMQSFILMPMGMLSGALFPFDLMPKALQTIANCLPFRWIIGGIEKMQKAGTILSALPNILLIFALSAMLYLTALYRTKSLSKTA